MSYSFRVLTGCELRILQPAKLSALVSTSVAVIKYLTKNQQGIKGLFCFCFIVQGTVHHGVEVKEFEAVGHITSSTEKVERDDILVLLSFPSPLTRYQMPHWGCGHPQWAGLLT